MEGLFIRNIDEAIARNKGLETLKRKNIPWASH